ncbi:MAG: NADH-quinone oxidoreductase subunit NuoE [Thermodesulfovibrionales bacterium]|nr:NADH-quinone oxidoreductase subunit NuoE [Thermodesulfovibrionales bacterium]
MLSDKTIEEVEALKRRYPDPRGAILPSLYIAQREFGWLSPEAFEAVSIVLGVPKAHLRGVASFYAMYRHKPVGRHLIQLCTNVSCMIFGAEDLVSLLKNRYGAEVGGTSPDGRFSLVIMECIGACEAAPAMLVNEDFHNNLTENNITEILEKYK